tara:strand:- start:5849 stop:6352 length:504 start_codon:yes stop_codon:yes gene_type:complete
MITIALIVAYAHDNIIGNRGELPWHVSDDLKNFKKITSGKPIIMGRKTFESIGKPLPNRHNIIVTKNREYEVDACTICNSLDDAISEASDYALKWGVNEIFVIGGAQIYDEALKYVTKAYITEIHNQFKGDTIFRPLDMSYWKEISRAYFENKSEGIPYSFVILEKK